jgi:hypothetical protein
MTKIVDIIYCYKNKDLSRVKKSLDSLALQNNQSFRVLFIDYGSDDVFAKEAEKLCQQYQFCTYYFVNSVCQMWSRGDALNYGFKLSDAPYVFTSDIDMVYKKNFISYLLSLNIDDMITYFFAVGYLNRRKTDNLNVHHLKNLSFKRSEDYALGMMFSSKKVIEEVNGYNSFYSIWGNEDNDIKQRIEKVGFKTEFVDKEVLMLHQYHLPSNGANLPDGWKQYLNDYGEHFFTERQEFNGLKQVVWPRKRPVLDAIKNDDVLVKKLKGRRLHIRHCILNDLAIQYNGKILKYEIDLSEYIYPDKSTIFAFIKSFNSFFSFINIPVKLVSLFKEQYLNKKDVDDEIYFILKSLENVIEDYYVKHFDNKIILVITKK